MSYSSVNFDFRNVRIGPYGASPAGSPEYGQIGCSVVHNEYPYNPESKSHVERGMWFTLRFPREIAQKWGKFLVPNALISCAGVPQTYRSTDQETGQTMTRTFFLVHVVYDVVLPTQAATQTTPVTPSKATSAPKAVSAAAQESVPFDDDIPF